MAKKQVQVVTATDELKTKTLTAKQQVKIKPPGFGAGSAALQNDRVRYELENFTNGD